MMENQPPILSRRLKLNRVYIADTVCGKGVFASERIRAMRPIGRVNGQRHPAEYRSDYCVSFMDGALEPAEPYRFVNHSCEPNCELIEWEIKNEEAGDSVFELWIHSIKTIEKDEQLTIDYAWDRNAAIPCLCGSPSCRGWVCSIAELQQCIAERGRGSLER